MRYGPRPVPGPAGAPVSLAFRDVEYAYDGGSPVLRDVTFDVPAGPDRGAGRADRIGQVDDRVARGPPGRPGRRARIEFGGVDARELAPAELAAAVALVPQIPFVFDDTVRGNVALDRTGVDDADRPGGAAVGPGRRVRGPAGRRPGHHRRRARHVVVGRPAPAAHPGPGARRRPTAADPRRRHERGRSTGRGGDPGRAARGRLVHPGRRVPAGHHRARRRGGLPRARAGDRARPAPGTAGHRAGLCRPGHRVRTGRRRTGTRARLRRTVQP